MKNPKFSNLTLRWISQPDWQDWPLRREAGAFKEVPAQACDKRGLLMEWNHLSIPKSVCVNQKMC